MHLRRQSLVVGDDGQQMAQGVSLPRVEPGGEPGLIVGLLPRPLAWTGLVLAAIAETTTLVLMWPGLSPLLPIARFGGLVWLIVAGATLPLRRPRRRDVRREEARG